MLCMQLLQIKQEIENANISYPDYYLKDFHAYDGGNLNWKAAFEIESATSSLSMRVFKDDKLTPEVADQQFRSSFLNATQVQLKQHCLKLSTTPAIV